MATLREEKGSSTEPDRRRLRKLNEDLDLLELNLNQPPTGSRPHVLDLLLQLRHEINGAFAAPGSRDES